MFGWKTNPAGYQGPHVDPDHSHDTPMVWTNRGNMRVADLDYSLERVDEVDQIIVRPTYRDKQTGEIVRNDVIVLPLAPWQTGAGGRMEQMTSAATAAQLPGGDADKEGGK